MKVPEEGLLTCQLHLSLSHVRTAETRIGTKEGGNLMNRQSGCNNSDIHMQENSLKLTVGYVTPYMCIAMCIL